MLDAFAALVRRDRGRGQPARRRLARARAATTRRTRSSTAAPRPAPRGLARARSTWDDGALALTEPAMIDVGALGKGRLVDRVLERRRDRRGRRRRRRRERRPRGARRAAAHRARASVRPASRDRRVGGDGCRALRLGDEPARVGRRPAPRARCAHRASRSARSRRRGRSRRPRCAPTRSRPRCSSTADRELAHEWGVEWVRMTTDGRVEWSPGCGRLFVDR